MAKNQIKILGADTGLECEEVTQKDVTAFETALKNVLLKATVKVKTRFL